MSDVFDILMRIGVSDEITHALSKIGSTFDELHNKTMDLTDGFHELSKSALGIGTALTAFAAAGGLAFDKLAKSGDALASALSRLDMSGFSEEQVDKIHELARATAVAVPGTLITENIKLISQLQELTKKENIDDLRQMTIQYAELQRLAKEAGGAGGPGAIMNLARAMTGLGVPEEQIAGRLANMTRMWARGVITPEQTVQDYRKMADLGAVLKPEFRDVVLPWLEATAMPGRGGPAIGIEKIYEALNAPNPKTGQLKWFERGVLGEGVPIRQYGNDPYEFFQEAAKLLQRRGVNLEAARRGTGPDREQVERYIRDVLELKDKESRNVASKLILEGAAAMGAESPIEKARRLPPADQRAMFEALSKTPGEVREGMFAAITNFFQEVGKALGYWEIPTMRAVTDMFNNWTKSFLEMAKHDPQKLDHIITRVVELLAVLGGMGAALVGLRVAAVAFSPGGAAIIGLGLLAAAITDIANHWDKNKGALANLKDVNERWGKEAEDSKAQAYALGKGAVEAFINAIKNEPWREDFKDIGAGIGRDLLSSMLNIGAAVNRWQDAAIAWVNGMVEGLVGAIKSINWWSLFYNAIIGGASMAAPQRPTMPEGGGPPGRFAPVPGAPSMENQLGLGSIDRFRALPALRPTTLTDSFTQALNNMANKAQTQVPPFGAPRITPPSGGGGPFSNLWPSTATTAPAMMRQGSLQPSMPTSLASFSPGGAVTPGGGQRSKGVTIATNLNIDGRLLAQAISDHILSMLSDPSGAGAPDGSGFFPGSNMSAA